MIFKLRILKYLNLLMVGIHLWSAQAVALKENGNANLGTLGSLPPTIKLRAKVVAHIAMDIRLGLGLMT